MSAGKVLVLISIALGALFLLRAIWMALCVRVLTSMCAYGMDNRGAVRAMGVSLNLLGGFYTMRKVAYAVQARNSSSAMYLNHMWNGIGRWMA